MKIFLNFFLKNLYDEKKIIQLFENIFMEPIEIGTFYSSDILFESNDIEKSFLKDKKWNWSFIFLDEPICKIEKKILDSINDYSCVFHNDTYFLKNGILFPPFVLYSYSSSIEKNALEYDNSETTTPLQGSVVLKTNSDSSNISSFQMNLAHKMVKEYKDPSLPIITIIPEKNICVFVSNYIDEEYRLDRDEFFDKLKKKYDNIDYIGTYRNNNSNFIKNEENCSLVFLKYISKYKIMITMEKSKNKNYITSKIINGFVSNIIPVYWGSGNIHDYFNKERFLYIDNFKNNNVINEIEKIINNKDTFTEIVNKDIYNRNKIPFLFYNISNNVKKLLDQTLSSHSSTPKGLPQASRGFAEFQRNVTPNGSTFLQNQNQKINFISFGGPGENYHKTLNRIYKQAIEFYLFDEISVLTEEDLKNDKPFWDKHGQFIENSHRGYGYWIWKSYIIKKRLEQIQDNDILIYCDSGCELNKCGLERLYEYIDLINTDSNGYGIISFQMRYIEFLYTKKRIFDYFNYSENDKKNKQCSATIIIIKKNKHSIDIINKWYETCSIYNLINDDQINEDNRCIDNRHDQSIFSILVNKYGSIKIYDETYFEEFNTNWYIQGKYYPLLARRLRM